MLVMSKAVYIVDGVRAPSMRSLGAFSALMAHQLGNIAVNGAWVQLMLAKLFQWARMARVSDMESHPRHFGKFW